MPSLSVATFRSSVCPQYRSTCCENGGLLSRIMAIAGGISTFAAPLFTSDWVGVATISRPREGLVSHGFAVDEIIANGQSHRRASPVLWAGVLQIILSAMFTLWCVA